MGLEHRSVPRGQVTSSYRYTCTVAVSRIARGPVRAGPGAAAAAVAVVAPRPRSAAGQGRSDGLAHVAHRQHLHAGDGAQLPGARQWHDRAVESQARRLRQAPLKALKPAAGPASTTLFPLCCAPSPSATLYFLVQ